MSYRIGIIGFGVAGGTVAFLLARAGHEVTLFERALELGPVGAGILLQPSGQAVLKRVGLLDSIVHRSEPIHELYARTDRGKTLVRLPYRVISADCHAYGVHRGVLFDSIRSAVESTGVRVRLDCEIQSRRTEIREVYAVDPRGEAHGPFDLLIAADGSRSPLRSASGIPHRVHEYAYGALWGVGPCESVHGSLRQVVKGTQRLAGLLPLGGGQCNLFWGLRADSWEEVRAAGFPAWRDQVLRLCPESEEMFDEITTFEHLRFTTYRRVSMSRWHDGATVFIGDAAHAMSPHLGQGMNLALLDAESLADSLAETSTPQEAFRQFEAARRRHTTYNGRITYLLTPFFQSDASFLASARNLALPLMTRVPAIRKIMVESMAGIRTGLIMRGGIQPSALNQAGEGSKNG